MCKDMFFIPMLAKAFAAPNRRVSLIQTLADIKHIGSQRGYESGQAQWDRFMAAARPTASGRVHVGPNGVHVELDVPFPANVEVWIPDLQPAHCIVTLSTGLLIGELDLTAADLVWESAFEGIDFRMAADTADQGPVCARTYSLYGGGAKLHTYPGVESGSIGITLVRRVGE